jgi:hypothetical protein
MDVLINVFVDDADGRSLTVVNTPRNSAVPLMDYLYDQGFRICHDGWFSEAEEAAQRAAV